MPRRGVPGRKRGRRPGARPGSAMGAATARAREPKMAEEEAHRAVGSLPGPPPPDWARLPNEVLALILSWLPPEMLATRCRLVCRSWRDLVDGPAAWQLQWRREPSMRAALEAVGRFPPPGLEPPGRSAAAGQEPHPKPLRDRAVPTLDCPM
ncbi:F-box only protein 27-like [Crotalus adamanteus]|uniref:F-box only protein 27-like n=1 Tax=Crotalus adamanteus TaxID=8729 RepID=A0AAW1AXK8_CROAD